jgi:hypothetical protein
MADPLSAASGLIAFLSATGEVPAALGAIRNDKPDSVIVLSFRTLQAERIESLQQELLGLTETRQNFIWPNNNASTEAPSSFEFRSSEEERESRDRLNKEIDHNLHVYGIYHQSVLSMLL